jgi:hypothetical protein
MLANEYLTRNQKLVYALSAGGAHTVNDHTGRYWQGKWRRRRMDNADWYLDNRGTDASKTWRVQELPARTDECLFCGFKINTEYELYRLMTTGSRRTVGRFCRGCASKLHIQIDTPIQPNLFQE